MNDRSRTTPATARPLSVTLFALLALAAPTRAQEAITYLVHEAGGGYELVGETSFDVDFSQDRDPMRVVQGAEWTWIVEDGDSLTRDNAAMILNRGQPVRPGVEDLVIRGWRQSRVESYDSFFVSFRRGDDDRDVAGHPAEHYRMTAFIRSTSMFGDEQRYAWDADFWVLPDLPHSWAPFGFGTRSLPNLAPRLRDTLDVRLGDLGLVGRAVIRMDYAMIQDGEETGGSRQATAFQISEVGPADPPVAAGVPVDESVLEALEQQVLDQPSTACGAAAEGRIPDALGDVPDAARAPLLARLNDGCGSPELYYSMLEAELRSDPEPLCQIITTAGDPKELADQVFTEGQRAAFLEFVEEAEQVGFHQELRRFCQRGG